MSKVNREEYEKDVKNKLGRTIRSLRLKHKMSQPKLAMKLGVHHKTISQWELGRAVPAEQNLIRLKGIFSLSDDEFEALTVGIMRKRVVTPKDKEKAREQRLEALRAIGNIRIVDLDEDDPRLLKLRIAYGAL